MFMLYPTCVYFWFVYVYFWSIWPITSTMFYFYHVHWMRDIPRVIHNICGHLCNAKAHLNAHCGNLRFTTLKYASILALPLFLAPHSSLGNEIFNEIFTTSRIAIYNISDTHTCGHIRLSALFSYLPHI